MTRREPPDVAILAARLMRAWPALSPFSCASLADDLVRIERAQRRHAERCCSGADGGYVKRGRPITGYGVHATTVATHDPEAEQRAGKRIRNRLVNWQLDACILLNKAGTPEAGESIGIELQGDPRGPVLLLRLPNEREASTV